MKISFVIPVMNEEKTLRELVTKISIAVDELKCGSVCEILLVDDGSNDKSWEEIQSLSLEFKEVVKGVKLRRNFGKATALAAGFRHVSGDIVFTMDADLQDDPKEIPRFMDKISEGFDVVSGWKKRRNDPFSKTLPSKFFNLVTSRLSGVELHDFNCGFKCYKREVIDQLNVYGELHRYLPILAADLGYHVGEIEVEHHARQHGVSKYGIERYVRGLLDLITVLATTRWIHKPGHLFGGVGILFGIIGVGVLAYLTVLWFAGLGPIGNRPLLIFGALFSIFSVQMISLGLIAEFFIKIKGDNNISILISEAYNIEQDK